MQFNEDTSAQGGGSERDGPARVRRMRVAEVAALLRQDAEAVARALLPGGHREGRHWVAASIRKGGPGDSLKVNIAPPHVGRWRHFATSERGDLLDLARREMGRSAGEEWARRRVGDHGAESATAVRIAEPVRNAKTEDAAQEEVAKAAKRATAQRLWDEAQAIEGTQAAAYLAARLPGADVLALLRPGVLRFHPDHRHDNSKRRFPLMVGAVTEGPGGPLLAVHRTYLHPDPDRPEKAPVEPAKMGLGSPEAGGVWLTEARPRMVVGEGIETTLSGLAAMAGAGWRAVAARDASGLKNLVLPPEVREVCILVDVDELKRGKRAGEDAARAGGARWAAEGRTVTLAFPGPAAGPPCDFNDLWREGGASAVRAAIEAAEVVPDPAIASGAEYQERIMQHFRSLLDGGPDLPRGVHITERALPLPDVLPLADARAQVEGVALSWMAAAARAWAGDAGAVKVQAGRMAWQELMGLPHDDPRRQPGRERGAFLVERRRRHRAELRQRLNAAGWSVPAPLPGMMVLKATVGLGKTEAAIAAVARVRHEAPIQFQVTWLAPTHNLAQETKARFADKGVPAVVLGGRNQLGPDGAALCDRAALAKRVGAAGLNVRRTLCQRAGEECPFFRTCGYFRQVENIEPGAVVIATHDALRTGRLPGGGRLAGLVIVDESPVSTFMKGAETDGKIIDLRRLARETGDVWPQVAPVLREVDGLLHLADRGGEGWRNWLSVRSVTMAGLRAAADTLHAAIPRTVGSPSDDDAIGFGLHRAERGIRDKRKIAALFDALARDWGHAGRNIQSVAVGGSKPKAGEETGSGDETHVWLAFQRPAPVPDGVSLLVLDATADDDLTRAVLESKVKIERVEARQYLAVVQAASPSFSMNALGLHEWQSKDERDACKPRQRMALNLVLALVKRHGRGKVAVITYLALRKLWEPIAKEFGFVLGHFNGMRGSNAMGDCNALVVVGRVQPSRLAAEAMARTIYADDPVPLVGLLPPQAPGARAGATDYDREVRPLLMDPSEPFGLETATHADPRVAACMRHIRDAELSQAIGRLRGVNADPSRPKEVFLLADVPLSDLEVHEPVHLPDFLNGMAAHAAQDAGPLPLDRESLAPRVPHIVARRDGAPGSDRWQREKVADFERVIISRAVKFRKHERGRRNHLYNTYIGESAGGVRVYGIIANNASSPVMILSKHDLPTDLAAVRAVLGGGEVVYCMQDVLAVWEAQMRKNKDGLAALRAAVAAAEVVAQHATALEAAVRAGDKAASDAIWEPLCKAWDAQDEAFCAWVGTLSPAAGAERLAERAALGREAKGAGLRCLVDILSPFFEQRGDCLYISSTASPTEIEWLKDGAQKLIDAWFEDRNLFTDDMLAQPMGRAMLYWIAFAEAETARATVLPALAA